eukprot:5004061-Pyramimonas_sp.AAC.1
MIVFQCEGGMAQLMGRALKLMFLSAPHNLRLGCVGMDLASWFTFRLAADLIVVLGDDGALHRVWMRKGCGGIMPRLQRVNLMHKHWVAAGLIDGSSSLRFHFFVSYFDECASAPKAIMLHV